jgi:hypothetical protein
MNAKRPQTDVESVNPVSRDKLTRLGDKLDAADLDGGDDWVGLFFEYEALALKHALQSKPPKVTIKTRRMYWRVWGQLSAVYQLQKDMAAAISDPPTKRSMRQAADLKAMQAVAHRDWQIIAAEIRKYEADQKASRARWREARRAVRIPERDRIPQR